MKIYIVTYKRTDVLNETLETLYASDFSKLENTEVNIINNHTEFNLDEKFTDITKNIDFSELCITSKAKISFSKIIETKVDTIKAKGSKCPVCWKINEEPCARHS